MKKISKRALKKISNKLRLSLALLLSFSLCLVGCGATKDIDDSFGEDFVPVMAGVQETTQSGTSSGGNTNGKKRVAITYDDGPHTTRTVAIVDELKKYGFHATFFVVGNRVDGTKYGGGQAMLYAVEAGNEIAIHGYTHGVYYHNCSDSVYEYELSQTVKAIQSVKSGYNPRLMRPIGGNITGERVSSCPYSVIMWSVDSQDWKNAHVDGGVDKIVNNVMSTVKDGDIILMHDIYENTYEASKIILKQLYEEGYEVVTVSELLGNDLAAGKKYSKR